MLRPTLDFERNDLDAALAAWKQNDALPEPDPDLGEALVMMFDDPAPFLAALDALAAPKPARLARRPRR